MKRLMCVMLLLLFVIGCSPFEKLSNLLKTVSSDEMKAEIIKHDTDVKAELERDKIRLKFLNYMRIFLIIGLVGGIGAVVARLPKPIPSLGIASIIGCTIGLGITMAMEYKPIPMANVGLTITCVAAGSGLLLLLYSLYTRHFVKKNPQGQKKLLGLKLIDSEKVIEKDKARKEANATNT